MRGHIDLFSGIGGFSLACQWNGIQTEVFCEKDKRCQEFLSRTYPGIPIVPDILEFDGKLWRERFLLTAGVPCQPASRAGKQRGKGDDRWMWPEALRVVSEARPHWVLFENPDGINDVGLDGILADLEALDYEVAPPLIVPACAVNSPQIRKRYWIVAYRECGPIQRGREPGILAGKSGRAEEEGNQREWRQDASGCGGKGRMAHAECLRRDQEITGDRRGQEEPGRSSREIIDRYPNVRFWSRFVWVFCADGKFRRAPDDSFDLVDGLHRSVLAALGNSIVPQVAAEIIRAIAMASS